MLSSSQEAELNLALEQYLSAKLPAGLFSEVQSALKKEVDTNLKDVEIPENYLEKKWATVLRLQKRILDLEDHMERLQSENTRLIQSLTQDQQQQTDRDLRQMDQPSSSMIDKMNWVPTKLQYSLKYHSGNVTAIEVHPSRPIVASGSYNGDIAIWNLLDLAQPIKVIPNAHSRQINDLKFQPDVEGRLLVSCSGDQCIKLWDWENTNVPTMMLNGHEHTISSLNFYKNQLVSCSRDSTIKIWDIESGISLQTYKGHSEWVRNLAIMEDWMMSCSNDTTARLTYLPTLKGIGMCINDNVIIEDVEFIPRNSFKYIPNYENEGGHLYAISVDRGKMIKIWKLPKPQTSFGGAIEPPETPNGEVVHQFKAHRSWIKSITFHSNGRFFATCGDDGFIKIWDLKLIFKTNGLIKELKHSDNSFVNKVQFAQPILTSDERSMKDRMRMLLISCGSDELINLWS